MEILCLRTIKKFQCICKYLKFIIIMLSNIIYNINFIKSTNDSDSERALNIEIKVFQYLFILIILLLKQDLLNYYKLSPDCRSNN